MKSHCTLTAISHAILFLLSIESTCLFWYTGVEKRANEEEGDISNKPGTFSKQGSEGIFSPLASRALAGWPGFTKSTTTDTADESFAEAPAVVGLAGPIASSPCVAASTRARGSAAPAAREPSCSDISEALSIGTDSSWKVVIPFILL